MTGKAQGWDWFQPASGGHAAADDPAAGELDAAIRFARCFADADGQAVLSHLRAMTLERTLGPAASDAHLRHMEGQRQLVIHILSLVARGHGRTPPAAAEAAARAVHTSTEEPHD
jgi:hypothetical protein